MGSAHKIRTPQSYDSMALLVYFGVPGSGKSTYAAKLVYRNKRKGITTYCNFPVTGSVLIDSADLGIISLTDGDLIIDEAGIDFNSRAYKSLPKYTIQWLKLYRHYGIGNIHVFSQSYDDMDITLRRLCDSMYRLKRSVFPGVFSKRRIKISIDIDKESHQVIDRYSWSGIPSWFSGRKYWPMFDSWSAPSLPECELEAVGVPADANFRTFRKELRRVRLARFRERVLRLSIKVYNRITHLHLHRPQ